jgi:peroxiredoxin
MYGRAYFGAQHATFVIGPDGVVAHVIPKVTPKTHDDEVLAVLEQRPRRSGGPHQACGTATGRVLA